MNAYVEMMRRLKRALPDVLIQGFTAVEIDYFAKIAKLSTLEVLKRLQEAGLDSLPGGGAEIFSERARLAAWEQKIPGEEWLRIHGEAHSLGMKTNATMLYGHVETLEERVDHLIALREQQDKTGGFLAFIPLAFHPLNTELQELPSTTGFDDVKTLAISRLMLDNFPHVKAFWIMVGLKVAQLATVFGVDDLDGTVVEERITHAAGATTPEALSKEELVRMIAETGHTPVERDTLYNVVRTYTAAGRSE
jgi:aminodeoxyfutalosine synthase